MRDYRDAKAMAQTLRTALAAMGFKITVSQSLELIAQAFGVADWNTLSAAIRGQATAVSENTSPSPPSAESAKTPGNPPNPLPVDPLSGELKSTLNQAFAYARGRKHAEITLEHLLFFLLDDADASRVMKASGVNLDDLRKKLTDYIDNKLKIQAIDGGDNPKPALGFQRVLQRAVFHVQQAGRFPVKTLNVLVAIFSEQESHAVNLLNEQGVTRMDVINYITHGTMKGGGGPADSPTTT
jgi:Glyoxalase superfamily protein/Clp amino terminal domain, pathogenicity island component